MKNPLLTLASLAMASSAFAQGTITFFNNNIINPTTGATYRAGIFRDNDPNNPADADIVGQGADSTVGAGAGITVGLFLANDLTTPLGTAQFRTGSAQEVFATTQDLVVNGVAPGATGNFVVRAWTTSYGSYDAAVNARDSIAQYGHAPFTSKPLGGTNPNPPPPSFFTPDMAPFTGFEMDTSVFIPEPSTFALGALSLGALLLRRRR